MKPIQLLKTVTATAALLIAAVTLPGSAKASLMGATVDGCNRATGSGGCQPTFFSRGGWSNASATVGAGDEFRGRYSILPVSADFTANTLTFTLFNNQPFIGFSPTEREIAFVFTGAPAITGFSHTGGMTPSSLSFTPEAVFFRFSSPVHDFARNTNGTSKSATFQITTAATTVPVPPAAWFFGTGLLGLVGFARRKRAH